MENYDDQYDGLSELQRIERIEVDKKLENLYKRIDELHQEMSPWNKQKYAALRAMEKAGCLPKGYENRKDWINSTEEQWRPLEEELNQQGTQSTGDTGDDK